MRSVLYATEVWVPSSPQILSSDSGLVFYSVTVHNIFPREIVLVVSGVRSISHQLCDRDCRGLPLSDLWSRIPG